MARFSARFFTVLLTTAAACPTAPRRLPRGPTPRGGNRLFDGYAADHAVPVVIGAAQIVGAGLVRREQQILALAGLHHDFGALAIEDLGIVDIGGAEKCRRRDLVGF